MWLLALAIGLVYASFLYLFSKKYSKGLTVLLFALRTIVVATVVMLFVNPYIKQRSYKIEKPIVILAQDNSESIVLSKDSVFYKEKYPQLIDSIANVLEKDYDVEKLLFGGSVILTDDFNSRHFDRPQGVEKSSANIKLQLLFEWIRSFGFSYSQCESIFAALDGDPGKEFFSNDYQLVVEKETIEIFPKAINALNAFNAIKVEKFEKTPNFSLQTSNSNIAQLDYDTLKLPLKTRFWQQGDRFRPLGMHGTKLASDFFNDNNFTTFQKKTTPILVDANDQIVWIVRHRIDDRFKITEKTKTIYEIKCEK